MTIEEKKINEAMWNVLTRKTASHPFYCACDDCERRNEISKQLIAVYDAEFQERKARIESWRKAA